jgi:hypothetical protein
MHQPNQTFKHHRRNIAKVASASTSLAMFDRVQNEEAAHFLLNVLDSPDDLFEHIRKEAGAVILRITYGYMPNAQGRDPLVDMAGQTMADFADSSVPGKWPVDVFPFRKFPTFLVICIRCADLEKSDSSQIGVQVPVSSAQLVRWRSN